MDDGLGENWKTEIWIAKLEQNANVEARLPEATGKWNMPWFLHSNAIVLLLSASPAEVA